jgi:DNA-binding transcriptional regulator LsrR (DeoR family)
MGPPSQVEPAPSFKLPQVACRRRLAYPIHACINVAMHDRKEDAARAAWLYFVRGYTQDEVALQLGMSRPTTQRLISFAVSEELVRFKIDHPIVGCVALGVHVARCYGLDYCDVAPTDPKAGDAREVIAPYVAERILRIVSVKRPVTLGVGSGRTLRAAVEKIEPIKRPQHRIVSLVGSTSSSGRAGHFEVVMRLADRIGADRYPLQLPVVAESAWDRATLQGQRSYATLLRLRMEADAVVVGIGEVGERAQIVEDGFLTSAEMEALVAQGAVGEITGWAFDARGNVLEGPINDRVASMPLTSSPERPTIIAGGGKTKIAPLRAALAGRLATALITDEQTALALLSS